MSKHPVTLTAMAAFAAAAAIGAFTHDSAAQDTPQLRRLPAQIAPAQIAPAQIAPAQIAPAQIAPAQIAPARAVPDPRTPTKPSRVQPLRLKAGERPGGPGKLATGAATGGPDTPSQLSNLVVIPYYDNPGGLPEGFPTHSYCMKKPTGGTPNQIRFYIRNAGGSDSGSFQWTPSFPSSGAAPAQAIPNIPANGQLLITQGIPNGCYTPGFSGVCQFSIHLDDHDEVAEWSEANTYGSYCVSPAG